MSKTLDEQIAELLLVSSCFQTHAWHYDIHGNFVAMLNGENTVSKICDIRGWGYLTGGGGLSLPTEKAIERQKAVGELIALAPQMAARILDDASIIDGLQGVIDSQKQTHDVLVKKLQIATEALRDVKKNCGDFHAAHHFAGQALAAITKENENV